MTAYEMRISDCSSDVCSSDLGGGIVVDVVDVDVVVAGSGGGSSRPSSLEHAAAALSTRTTAARKRAERGTPNVWTTTAALCCHTPAGPLTSRDPKDATPPNHTAKSSAS